MTPAATVCDTMVIGARLTVRRIRSFALLILAATLLGSGCVKKVTIAEELPVGPEVSTDELINRINSFSEITTFSAQGYVYVRNYYTSKATKAEEFPYANQLIRLRRPENIRMKVTAPVVGSRVADMATNGQKFQLALYYPSDKRRFLYGSNLSELHRMAVEQIEQTKDEGVARAGGLINMRPQHITDAFLIKPTTENDRIEVFREEVRQTEPDTRPGKKKKLVDKRYYILYVLERNGSGTLELLRKFWFDRTQIGTPLVRQQIFENGVGRLGSDITYIGWFNLPDTNRKWPKEVIVERRNDGYSIKVEVIEKSVEVNAELPDSVFILQNDDNLEEIDLDAPRKAEASTDGKPGTRRPSN